jgi:hypothetical protein
MDAPDQPAYIGANTCGTLWSNDQSASIWLCNDVSTLQSLSFYLHREEFAKLLSTVFIESLANPTNDLVLG